MWCDWNPEPSVFLTVFWIPLGWLALPLRVALCCHLVNLGPHTSLVVGLGMEVEPGA